MSGGGLRDEIAGALATFFEEERGHPPEQMQVMVLGGYADAVLPVVQARIDAAREQVADVTAVHRALVTERDDYRARLKATDESWAKLTADRDAAVARAEAAEQAVQRVRERLATWDALDQNQWSLASAAAEIRRALDGSP